ncbi:hypothetical protein DPMN_125885 [Dreissena polymorpha]|uniref:Uncharacterized protein n=1 Tax=Dreissena polymorpha TaxID=45954 RepID=A0A9D4H297_DREPO|nr:hypothetical protein DPMN_125885 [Dreissena polymorpha]
MRLAEILRVSKCSDDLFKSSVVQPYGGDFAVFVHINLQSKNVGSTIYYRVKLGVLVRAW